MDKNNNYIKWGSGGETIVLLHYFGGSARSWKWIGEELGKEYCCIAINLPGFGGATAQKTPLINNFAGYVQEILDSLNITSYTLIGHSMGAKIAMQLASNATQGAVRQLILVAPSPPTTEPMPQKEKERMLNHPDRKEAEETVKGATKKELNADQFNLAVDTQLIIDHNTWRWWLLEGMEHSIAERINLRSLPVTVIASKDDPIMTPEVIDQRVMQVINHASLISTEGIGHLIPLEAENWLGDQIRKIIAKANMN